ncbi:MAG: YlxR family protein [Lachnospiraceae bacterium]|jgi:predicted RNA-binding protein YlxR (DUF448 family)|nr:YlxR family protein [Lachnospiraceae bacterium]
MAKKIPMRTCIGCGICKEKKALIRLVHTKDGQILVDRTGRVGGRGAYLCDDPACLEKAVKRGAIARAFGVPVSRETILALQSELSGTALTGSKEEQEATGGVGSFSGSGRKPEKNSHPVPTGKAGNHAG